MNTTIHIAFTCDRNYIGLLNIAIDSLLSTATKCKDINIYILSNDISKRDLLQKYTDLSINIVPIPQEIVDLVSNLPLSNHFTHTAYYRIFLQEILDVDKVLYLDPDIIVRKDISELYNIDISDYYIAACPEVFGLSDSIRIGNSYKNKYFNSGILLLNLKKMRMDCIPNKIINECILNCKNIEYPDQDVLNLFFKNSYFELDIAWNCPAYIENCDANIIHFCGSDKLSLRQGLLKEYAENIHIKLPERVCLKNYIKKIIYHLFKNNLAIKLYRKVFHRIFSYCEVLFQQCENENNPPKHLDFSVKSVLHGPFSGMYYGDASFCSTLYPKLIGCYELCLQQVIEKIIKLSPKVIIDIGCAEGYYSVGMAYKCPDSNIYAFDIDLGARCFCRNLASKNNVLDRVHIGGECKEEDLLTFAGVDCAIICDCEGAEKKILTKSVARALHNAIFLIEVHDYFDITISEYLHNIFKETHEINIITEISDSQKAYQYSMEPLDKYTLEERKLLVSENRSETMQWFFCEPKQVPSC